MHRPDMEDDEPRLRGARREAEDSVEVPWSVEEYVATPKDEQWPRRLRGNTQKDGLRRLANVTSRSMPARPPRGIVDSLHDTFHCRAVLYTTHGHTPDSTENEPIVTCSGRQKLGSIWIRSSLACYLPVMVEQQAGTIRRARSVHL